MAILKIKDALGNVYPISAIKGESVSGAAISEVSGNYHLILTLTNGETVDAGVLPNATPVGTHTHGNVTYDGKIGSASGKLVETGANGALMASRKIVTGTTPPSQVTGLSAGDIYLYYEA